MKRPKRGFGSIRRLPSRRYQANYTGPDTRLHKAPRTFDTRGDAEAWLTDIRRQISSGEWPPDGARQRAVLTFGVFAGTWLERRRTLKPTTRAHYGLLLDRYLLPTFAPMPLRTITADDVVSWHAGLSARTPTLRAHCYALLRTILGDAVRDEHLDRNPAHIHDAGSSKTVHRVRPATLAELETIAAAMPQRYRLMVLLASWCALRFGELAELRRSDIDVTNAVIRVRRGVTRVAGQEIVGTPKSDAGIRDVAVPPHLMPLVREHLAASITGGRSGLMFPATDGGHLAPSSLYWHFHKARDIAGRGDLRFHDLRHTGAVLAASTGATLAELMARLGHSTPTAAMRYQHAAAGRDQAIAHALSELADGGPR